MGGRTHTTTGGKSYFGKNSLGYQSQTQEIIEITQVTRCQYSLKGFVNVNIV